jgi:hypothetical protein
VKFHHEQNRYSVSFSSSEEVEMVGFMMVVLVGVRKSMKKSNKPNTTQYARAGEVQVNCIWILVLVAMSGHT